MIKKPKRYVPMEPIFFKIIFYINALTIAVIVQFLFILYILGVLL